MVSLLISTFMVGVKSTSVIALVRTTVRKQEIKMLLAEFEKAFTRVPSSVLERARRFTIHPPEGTEEPTELVSRRARRPQVHGSWQRLLVKQVPVASLCSADPLRLRGCLMPSRHPTCPPAPDRLCLCQPEWRLMRIPSDSVGSAGEDNSAVALVQLRGCTRESRGASAAIHIRMPRQ
jgi:hypothetical protein